MMSKIFYHDVSDSYPSDILNNMPGVVTYAGRVFASTAEDDVLVLPPETASEYDWIRRHYEVIGLNPTKKVLFGSYEMLKDYPEYELSSFFFGQKAAQERPNERWFKAAAYLNNKNNFIWLALFLGVRVPNTVCYSVGEEVLLPKLFPVYVKLAVSASGFGIWRCEDATEFQTIINTMTADFQVQEALPEGTVFLNVQYVVDDSWELEPSVVTKQILEGNTHNGNIFPVAEEARVHANTMILARWAYKRGIKGTFAFDVALTPKGELLPIECNPRWNGSSYYSTVADKLGLREWQSINVSFKPRTFRSLNLGELSLNRDLGEGIAIINWGCVGEGKLGILVAGKESTRRDYLAEFKHRFG